MSALDVAVRPARANTVTPLPVPDARRAAPARRPSQRAEQRRSASVLAAMAYHEAGHAVASVILSLPFQAVTIRALDERQQATAWPTPDAAQVQHEVGAGCAWRARMQDYLTRILAGDQAEARWRLRRTRRPEWRSDRTLACDLALTLTSSPEEASALVAWLTLRARNLAAKPDVWPGVAAVATALLERETLSATEVRMLFEQEIDAPTLERLSRRS